MPEASSNSAAAVAPAPTGLREVQLAVWNAIKLGASLVLTWGLSLAIRAVLPRYLGPSAFGDYSFADALAMSFFVFCTLGVDTYVQKEVPVRHQHASEIFGSVAALRLVVSGVLILGMWCVAHFTHRSAAVQLAAVLFGIGQIFFITNATFVAMLNARGNVDGMSIVNVLTKVSWGVGIGLCVLFKWGICALAASFIVSEGLRCAALFRLCRTHVELRVSFLPEHLKPALVRCAPFFVTTLALTLYSRFDIMLLAYLADSVELGWYSAAAQVSNLGLMMIPLISAVCLPMFSRARRRSDEELNLAIRKSLEVVLMFALPVSLALFVGADVWIKLLGGAGFEPAAKSLRAIAPIFALTYLAMLSSSCLNLINRAWTVTKTCLLGIVINAVLNVVLIKWLGHALGNGGAGVGAALADVVTEACVCTILLSTIGQRLVSKRLVSVVIRTVGTCLAVIALDFAMRPLGPARVLLDGAAYIALAFLFGALRMDELKATWTQLRARPAS